ncbi:MAG: peptidoglycan bridge formation glycyltransferase FemA/FemB family protein [Patescibacteria group bacterium]|jgi:lipid II:glycine glycyltransferase (peptidoglycan interpeptide bridge formation enzyme)
MEFKEIKSQKELNTFIGSQTRAQFLQSWGWGEFQVGLGRQIWRLGVLENEKIIGSALIVRQPLPFGKCYLYCPRGPVVDGQLPVDKHLAVLKTLASDIVGRAARSGAMFVKLEPPLVKIHRRAFDDLLREFNYREAGFVQPRDSWYLDLSKSEEELIQAMHQKTRYNIRLAEKKDVHVRVSNNPKDFEIFWQLNKMTSERDQFQTHSQDYYQKMLETLLPAGFQKIFIAEYEGKSIAANIVVFYGDTATYLHGASADEYRNVMAPHLLQWRQIQEAKKLGLRYYDFWGVAPEGSIKEKAWAGITRFKKGFGGTGVSYLGAFDLILNKFWYKLYKIGQKIKS